MHNEIYQHFNSLDITPRKVSSDPTDIYVVDNFLPQNIYEAIVKQIADIPDANYNTFENESSSRTECRNPVNAPLIETLQREVQELKDNG